MLSATARPYIEASVPVLREHGLNITRTFYQNMLGAHPELKNLFNMGNQASGIQQQSLASAVFAYAANIDNPAALAPVVKRIVHKHAAVGIKPEHYPIVGKHLLDAIKQVLGDAASDELLAAWGEAYWLLADLLIEEEKVLYAATATTAGALMPLKVARKVFESEHIVSFYLQHPDGRKPGDFLPGQYISVEMQFDGGRSRQLRQYSLSDSSAAPWWRISIKREEETDQPQGRVSNWLHDEVKVGDLIQATPAFGDFVLNPVISEQPLLLLSAGVGITPLLSMLNSVRDLAPQRKVFFAYAARSPAWQSHSLDLQEARGRMSNLTTALFYESLEGAYGSIGGVRQGLMDVTTLWPEALENADIYMCGPLGFMQAQREQLLKAGVTADQIHREVFGPDLLDHLL
ncbi:NO-inducible flavohemoprotein [Methylobacillus arboreus]|uniref:NO-inducible flavohemoprotein n=1 Tax=Methylobacillus arboreus TaxID=755170 RepID=UPI001E47A92B|nr:NO-inducible flavohemoprotein [Methylobacillus arboreus]MCB5191425.1 NO-inducible flavohemoprotein [Methylobacillus arboreus]